MDAVFLIGRILFALIFVMSGVTAHLVQRRQSTEYAKSQGAPAPELLVPLSGVVILLGGLAIAFGIWADLGALAVGAFALAMLPTMHAFWKVDDPMMRPSANGDVHEERLHGRRGPGHLLDLQPGPGPPAVDYRRALSPW